MVGQAWEHAVVAAEQEVWTQPHSTRVTVEPTPKIPLLVASAFLGHAFWGALVQKVGVALLKVWLSFRH